MLGYAYELDREKDGIRAAYVRIRYSNSPSGISYLIPSKMDCYPGQNLVEITSEEIGKVKYVHCRSRMMKDILKQQKLPLKMKFRTLFW